jgi:GNAT superfamily N-acetyltransferase
MIGVNQRHVEIRPVDESDRPTVEWLTTQLWGACEVIVHEGVFYPAILPGFIAERSGRIAGLVTFEVRPGVLEIVTINALDLYKGIGTMLIEAVRAEAKRLGCHQVTLTTTNDNIGALRFYQRRGFRLAAIRPGAVDRSRQRKPEIPRNGDFGIPLRDEIDLACPVLKEKIGKDKCDDPERVPCFDRSEAANPRRSKVQQRSTSSLTCCREPGLMRYTGTYHCPREHHVATRWGPIRDGG